MFPRGGGIWDQDPILMRDFRIIRDYEIKWKETREQLQQAKGAQGAPTGEGQPADLEGMLQEMLEEEGYDKDQFF